MLQQGPYNIQGNVIFRIPDCGVTERFFVYGGMSMLCCPLNDGWILNLDIEQRNAVWEQIDLSYDHGEVRCWHTAICMKEGLVFIGLQMKSTD